MCHVLLNKCQKSLDCLFGIAKSEGARDFDEANICFIKSYRKEAPLSLLQFSPQEEDAAFRSSNEMSIENGRSFVFINVISSNFPTEIKYHVSVNNRLLNKKL